MTLKYRLDHLPISRGLQLFLLPERSHRVGVHRRALGQVGLSYMRYANQLQLHPHLLAMWSQGDCTVIFSLHGNITNLYQTLLENKN